MSEDIWEGWVWDWRADAIQSALFLIERLHRRSEFTASLAERRQYQAARDRAVELRRRLSRAVVRPLP